MSLRTTKIGLIRFTMREARRMVGSFVMTELHLRDIKETPHSVGMGSYNMDSHNVQRYVAKNVQGQAYALNEGDIQVNPGGPYEISYGSLVPKPGECSNLWFLCAFPLPILHLVQFEWSPFL